VFDTTLKMRRRGLLLCSITIALWCSALVNAEAVPFDPTRPANHAGAAPATKTFRLDSIMTGEGRQLAFINGKAVAVGDRIGLGVITSISEAQVVVLGSKRHVLTMDRGLRKLPSENRR
jgi:hypothetical protein